MKARYLKSLCILVVLLWGASQLPADSKPIRLRNEIIVTRPPETPPTFSARSRTVERTNGLFLVQFADRPQAAWRDQLRALGVTLVAFVPEDAFVARLNDVSLDELRALSFVRWVGPYLPTHKVQRGLELLAARPGQPGEIEVSLLLSPASLPAELAEARQYFAGGLKESRPVFGTIFRGRIPATRLKALAASPAVLWVEPAPKMRLLDEVASQIVAGNAGPGQTLMQSFGYDGRGVTVAVADSGLDSGNTNSMHPDIAGRVRRLFFYGSLTDAADEHSHGTHCAGIVAGNGATGEVDEFGALYGLGVAPGASLIAQRLFGAEGNYEPPPTFETMTRDAVQEGADIGSNSWGDDTQGRYDLSAAEFDALVRDADAQTAGDQPYILEFSAGNAGPGAQTIGSPAVAKNVIATGASQNNRFNLPLEDFAIYADGQEAMADFSSRGPCEDGRIKPDVTAPGTWIASLRSVFANDDYAWWPISDNYMYQGGTSQAGPHVSGAAAVLVQYFREALGFARPSPALVKAALINSAVDMDDAVETGPVPNQDEGWGRVDLTQIINAPRQYEFVDQTELLTTGQVYERNVLVGAANEPLKITLAYTDVPGFPGAIPALVNDLDLEVVGPEGTLYRGNQLDFGDSVPNPPVPDSLNNVEVVHLIVPVPGQYTVRVRARSVAQDARRDTPAVDQDFALVISGIIAPAGTGIVTFDRSAYTVPGVIKLRLYDQSLTGQPTAALLLRSDTEFAGETITLQASGITGLFTANVVTVSGVATNNGRLEIKHGDVITAVYQDANPPATRTFTARADLLPPVITQVAATSRFGRTFVSWETDEDANAVVRYGTNTLNLAATNRWFETSHEVAITNLVPNRTYHFVVVSEDRAGNRATNDNGGAMYSFTTVAPPTVLLVDSYTFELLFPIPPLSGYTDTLDRIGVSYEVWDTLLEGDPTLADLNSYRCVIWRMDELAAPDLALPQAISAYVNAGGSLLIASMEAPTRLSEAGLPGFVTSVLQVQSYTVDKPVNSILGAPSDPVGSGINVALDYTPYSEIIEYITPDPSDWIVPTTNAAPILLASGATVGVRSPKTGVDLPGRVVYLSFPLDAVPLGTGVGNNRAGLLRNALNFLAPPPGNSTIVLDSEVYTLPSRLTVEVEDIDLAGQGTTTVAFSSPRQTNGVMLTLAERPRRGLFRGSLTLLAPGATESGPTLTAQSGDTIRAEYLDATAGSAIGTTATVETNAPAISGVESEPGFVDATVIWETSEPTDGLVQYSESPFTFPVNYTAYDPNLDTVHELTLTGLVPNRTYYFRVVSRDRAGNTTIDDNNSQLYTFTTLLPQLPPWIDDLEGGSEAWEVFSSEESEIGWQHGVPGNGDAAHSPVNAWGSNLNGEPCSQAETFLISPAIALTGGSRCTLRFWQNYDFIPSEFDIIEYGEVRLFTNVNTEPVTLAVLGEYSEGWEAVEVDLTPYLGNVVHVVWYYFLFSFEDPAPPRFGWLVDDVSLTVTNPPSGTLVVSNNLSQATFSFTGPVSRSGTGWGLVLSNALTGEYRISYGSIPYYQTPASQTNSLVANSMLRFEGVYSFGDTNQNGMADAWEQAWFNEVSPSRTPTTDTDGDGFPDYAEFIAGTNPMQPNSKLQMAEPLALQNGGVNLQWSSVAGRAYRIEASSNAVQWRTVTDWMRAGTSSMSVTLPLSVLGDAYLFRLEVRP